MDNTVVVMKEDTLERLKSLAAKNGKSVDNYLDDLLSKELHAELSNAEYRMTAEDYQFLASRTINQELAVDEMIDHAFYGMVGEIGEISSIYQKYYQGHGVNTDHLKKELGDLLWFVAEYCTAHDWGLEDVMRLNIEKLKARYPEGFNVDHSLHRAEGDI